MAHSGSGKPSWLERNAVASRAGVARGDQCVERARVEEGQVAGQHQPGGLGMFGERGADAGDRAFDVRRDRRSADDARARGSRAWSGAHGDERARDARRRAASSPRRAAFRRGGIRWPPCRAACACCGRRRAPGHTAAAASRRSCAALRARLRARLAREDRACRRSCSSRRTGPISMSCDSALHMS